MRKKILLLFRTFLIRWIRAVIKLSLIWWNICVIRWPYLYCFILKQGDVCKM